MTRIYGLLNNRLMEGRATVTPEVGMGATILLYSDRHACTIVEVLSPSRIVIQEDRAIRTDTNGMSDSQAYRYEPDANGEKHIVTLRRDGRWKLHKDLAKTTVALGFRDHHYDYGF